MLHENEEIDLLLVDYTMPEMNGAAVIKEVSVSHPWLPVLLMTGNAEPEAIRADLPDVPMLLKPFDQKELRARVASLLRPDADQPDVHSDAEAATV